MILMYNQEPGVQMVEDLYNAVDDINDIIYLVGQAGYEVVLGTTHPKLPHDHASFMVEVTKRSDR